MDSLRDIDRAMEWKIKKGSCRCDLLKWILAFHFIGRLH